MRAAESPSGVRIGASLNFAGYVFLARSDKVRIPVTLQAFLAAAAESLVVDMAIAFRISARSFR